MTRTLFQLWNIDRSILNYGNMAELVDAFGLEPNVLRRGGSSPSIPTTFKKGAY